MLATHGPPRLNRLLLRVVGDDRDALKACPRVGSALTGFEQVLHQREGDIERQLTLDLDLSTWTGERTWTV